MSKKKFTNYSRQQKARYIQNLVKNKIIKLFPSLTAANYHSPLTHSPINHSSENAAPHKTKLESNYNIC